MEEIKQLLTEWEENGYINPDSLAKACEAITLLVAKVETLQQQVDDLSA
jgi:hypothetical protein